MRLSVIGSGSWGTALARLAARQGLAVRLWAHEPEVVKAIEERRENASFLPGVRLPDDLAVTTDLGEAVRGAEMILLAVPSAHLRSVLQELGPHVGTEPLLVNASKGIEEGTLLRMSQLIDDVLGRREAVVLSGPTFAREVADDLPTALVAASPRLASAQRVQAALSTLNFRIYTNADVVGVELGGALKNVIAIAAGVSTGLGLGHNAVAALMTRGLTEISRLTATLGGKRRTLAGLAGVGDLVLTCTGALSRNRTVGIELAKGRSLSEILSSMNMVAEGVPTTYAAVALATRHRVEMPITFQMERLLKAGTTPSEAIRELMSRPLTVE